MAIIDIDLEEIDNRDILRRAADIIENEYLAEHEKTHVKRLQKALRMNNSLSEDDIRLETLDEQMKYEHFINVQDAYSLKEIELNLPEK
ncbi:MAG: hypothetical protein K9I74_14635 [Bacteroidales bacterium]|nr:hypothetical protein [Bacteroidales bacterium]